MAESLRARSRRTIPWPMGPSPSWRMGVKW